ncbi:hypothetical protein LZ32DRAFT_336164 [Colletotrichum eremochloae]|nr:hypothetical protein LZ32DRAFT_336164 [Colletotrichum eremochloae]
MSEFSGLDLDNRHTKSIHGFATESSTYSIRSTLKSTDPPYSHKFIKMSSGGSSSGGKKGEEQYRSGGYTSNDSYAWGSKGKSDTYIDNNGNKKNTKDGSYTYEYPPKKYNPDGTIKPSS